MFTFKDSKGRTWDLKINLPIARRLDQSDFRLYYDGQWSFLQPDKQVFASMLAHKSFMFAVIWAIVITQAKKKFIEGEFVFGKWTETDKATREKEVNAAFE